MFTSQNNLQVQRYQPQFVVCSFCRAWMTSTEATRHLLWGLRCVFHSQCVIYGITGLVWVCVCWKTASAEEITKMDDPSPFTTFAGCDGGAARCSCHLVHVIHQLRCGPESQIRLQTGQIGTLQHILSSCVLTCHPECLQQCSNTERYRGLLKLTAVYLVTCRCNVSENRRYVGGWRRKSEISSKNSVNKTFTPHLCCEHSCLSLVNALPCLLTLNSYILHLFSSVLQQKNTKAACSANPGRACTPKPIKHLLIEPVLIIKSHNLLVTVITWTDLGVWTVSQLPGLSMNGAPSLFRGRAHPLSGGFPSRSDSQ